MHGSSSVMRLVCKERPLPDCRKPRENQRMLPVSTTFPYLLGDDRHRDLGDGRNRWLTRSSWVKFVPKWCVWRMFFVGLR